jgi:hypothetical protein
VSNNLRTDELSAPLDGATTATIDINTGSGNLTIDQLPAGEQVLASGSLEYFEKQGRPIQSVSSHDGETLLKLTGGGAGQPWFHFPWAACNGATHWQIHVNPAVASDIAAHSGGGNVKLKLAGLAVTHVSADTGGGNMDIVLPEHASNLHVAARTGAGNVTLEMGSDVRGSNTIDADSGAGNVVVRLPRSMAARVHATSGLGKVVVDYGFAKLDGNSYETAEFDTADDKVEMTLKSGAGNVIVSTQ